MIRLDFYKEYISDLSKIAILESKEDNTIMTSEDFIKNVDTDNGEDLYNLNHLNDDDNFLIDCIGLQWRVYISESNKDLIKYKP